MMFDCLLEDTMSARVGGIAFTLPQANIVPEVATFCKTYLWGPHGFRKPHPQY